MSLGNLDSALNYRPRRTGNTLATLIPAKHGSWLILCLLIIVQAGCSEQKRINRASPNVVRFQFAAEDDHGNIDGARLHTCRNLDKLAGEKYVILTFYNPEGDYIPKAYSLKGPSGFELLPQCYKSTPSEGASNPFAEWEDVSPVLVRKTLGNNGIDLLYVTFAPELSTDFTLVGVGKIPREALK